MPYEIANGMGDSYYRRFSEVAHLQRNGEIASASVRLSSDLLEDMDNIAKHFGQSRNSFLVDLLFSGLQKFQNDYAQACYDAGDLESLQAFIDARGHDVSAESIFEKIRSEGLGGQQS